MSPPPPRMRVGGEGTDLASYGALCPAVAHLVQAMSPEHHGPSVPQRRPN